MQFGATAIFGKGAGGGLGAGEGEDELAAIDAILEEGEARTKALSDAVNAKVGNKGKGLLDFTFDGGMGTQTFEGVDYSREQQRKKALEDAALALKLQVAEAMAEQSALERAARKAAVLSYNEGQIFKALQVAEGEGGGGGGGSKSSKSQYYKLRALLPLEHRPPKRMDPWQLYDSARIMEITAQEIAWVQARHEHAKGMLAQPPATVFGGLDPSHPFPVDLILERSQLLQEAYPDWRKPDFDAYCMAVKTFGRSDAAAIARMLAPRGKGRAEVLRYHRDFWSRGKGKQCLATAAYNSLEKSVEKGEASIREIKLYEQSLTLRTARTQKGWNPAVSTSAVPAFGTPAALASDPWRNLEIPGKDRVLAASTASAAQSRLWTTEADRYILTSVARLGHGKYDLLRAAILHEPRFRFDHWLRCRTESDLESRAKALLKALDKELPEQLRKEDQQERVRAAEEQQEQRRKAYDAHVAKASAERLLASVRVDAETTAQRDAQLLAKKAEADKKKAAEKEAKEREKAAADAAKRAALEAALGATASAGASSATSGASGSKGGASAGIKGKHLAPTLVPPEYFPSIASFLKSCKGKTAEDAAGDYLRWYTSNNPTTIPAGQPGAMPKMPAKAQIMYLLEVTANRHKEPFLKTVTMPVQGAGAGPGKTREYSVTAYKYTWSWKEEYSQYAGVSPLQAAAEYAKAVSSSGPIMVTMMSYASATGAAGAAGTDAANRGGGTGAASASPAQGQGSKTKPASAAKGEEVVEMDTDAEGEDGKEGAGSGPAQ